MLIVILYKFLRLIPPTPDPLPLERVRRALNNEDTCTIGNGPAPGDVSGAHPCC